MVWPVATISAKLASIESSWPFSDQCNFLADFLGDSDRSVKLLLRQSPRCYAARRDAYAVVQLDLYTAVTITSTAVLLGAVAHVVLQRPRRRSAARQKSRSSSLMSSWSARWTRSSPKVHVAAVVVYVVLRVVHALLLTFSVTSLLVQV